MQNTYPINYINSDTTLIRKFCIYGERHSGTKLLHKWTALNFDVSFTEEYGHKHFFGFASIEKLVKSYDTIFLCIIRNPYDWILANNKQKHHCPVQHKSSNFIYRKDWYSINGQNTEILQDRCYWDNIRYKNIYELRYWKTIYLLYILPLIVHNYIFIQYDNFINNQLYYYNFINDTYRIKSRPRSIPNRILGIEPAKTYSITEDELMYINTNISWHIEELCGFSKKSQV